MNKKHVTIGIDPSINSTGVCVSGMDNDFNIYYIIPSKITKKSIEWTKDKEWINIEEYEKVSVKDIDKYYEKEIIKFGNLFVLVETLSCILKIIEGNYIIDYATMEGVSYGSVKGAALVDLSFLNAMIRMKLHEHGIKFYIVSPSEVKRYAVGNGSAEKDVMIMSWKNLDKKTQSIPEWFKCDDLADAYFMAHYNPEFSE
jgi:Holliday junction resolvasome RuvABC endonuclease subunit